VFNNVTLFKGKNLGEQLAFLDENGLVRRVDISEPHFGLMDSSDSVGDCEWLARIVKPVNQDLFWLEVGRYFNFNMTFVVGGESEVSSGMTMGRLRQHQLDSLVALPIVYLSVISVDKVGAEFFVFYLVEDDQLKRTTPLRDWRWVTYNTPRFRHSPSLLWIDGGNGRCGCLADDDCPCIFKKIWLDRGREQAELD
jgi:hypothetical protein